MSGSELEGRTRGRSSSGSKTLSIPAKPTSMPAFGIEMPMSPSSYLLLAAYKRHHSSLRLQSLRAMRIKLASSASLARTLSSIWLTPSHLKRFEPQTSTPLLQNLRRYLFPATLLMPWAPTARKGCTPNLRKYGTRARAHITGRHAGWFVRHVRLHPKFHARGYPQPPYQVSTQGRESAKVLKTIAWSSKSLIPPSSVLFYHSGCLR